MIRRLKNHTYEIETKVIFETAWNIYPYVAKLIRDNEKKILDAGCGIGKIMDFIPKEKDVYGIDFSEEAIKIAKRKGYKKIVNVDLEKIPFSRNFFDLSLCIEVLQYVKDPIQVMKELKRVTKGRIIIAIPNHKWFKIRSIFSLKFRRKYKEITRKEHTTDITFIKELAYNSNLKISQIVYISRKLNNLRKLFGKYFASEIIAVLEK